MIRLSQGLGNGCIGIYVKNFDLDGPNVDVWGLIDLII
jgi:hypothetical protein